MAIANGRPRRGYQHEDFLTDVAGLLRHLNKEPLTLIGHSLGGSMALLYAGIQDEIFSGSNMFDFGGKDTTGI